ncbi:MAG TPA: hypothetical protein VNL73_04565 [Verrucomicrobiae bacterium]|nr:hypothetical protein [Verrucomicrobiae bacterium]
MSKRLILLTIGILTLFAVSVFATETRVATMGNGGLYLKDDAGIFFYPGTMSQYQKMVIAEHYSNFTSSHHSQFSYSDFRRVGIIMPAWGSGTLAIFAGEDSEHFNTGGAFPGPGFDEPTTRFLVGYGMNTGNSSLGFQVDFSGVREENGGSPVQVGTNEVFTASTWGFGFGLSTPMGDLNNLDFGFRLRIGSFEEKLDSSTDVLTNKSDGNMALSFVLRDYYALNDYMNLVPVGALGIASEKNIEYQGADSNLFKFNTTAYEFGLALQTKPTENSEIIGGAGYRSVKFREKMFDDASGGDTLITDFTTTDTDLPFAWLGFETAVKNWLHFRLGVEKVIATHKEKAEKPVAAATADEERNELKETDSPLSYAVGVGIHAGPVTMDAEVTNDWWNAGPNFLSGQSYAGGMFPRISFTYNFK